LRLSWPMIMDKWSISLVRSKSTKFYSPSQSKRTSDFTYIEFVFSRGLQTAANGCST
jgi:hypothetical protein